MNTAQKYLKYKEQQKKDLVDLAKKTIARNKKINERIKKEKAPAQEEELSIEPVKTDD